MKIIDQSNIIDVKQKCHDEYNKANSMVKKICKTVTISLFLKFSTKYKQRVLTILVFLILKDQRKENINFLHYSQKVSRSLKIKETNYVLLVDILYRRYKTRILLKILGTKEALLVIFEVHEGLYRAHQFRIKMRQSLMNHGF